MGQRSASTSELDELVDAVLRGERLLLFPPGIGAFVLASLALTVGASALVASALPALVGGDVARRALTQMVGLLACLPTLVVPAALVALGRPSGLGAVLATTRAWLLVTILLTTAVALGAVSAPWQTCAVALCSFALALLVAQRPIYRLFALYKHRLRTRRIELLQR